MTNIHNLLADPVHVQIAEAVSREELSPAEISEILHEDKQKISHELTILEDAHVVEKHTHGHHQATYALAEIELEQAIHILYGLWADTLALPQNYSTVQI